MSDRNDDKPTLRRTTPIEDRLWPVNLVLVVLGAFLIGVTLAFVSFDNPVWYANGWLHVTAVTLLIGGWIAAANLVKNQFIKRSMQSAAGISLGIHVVLVILLVFTASTPPEAPVALLTKRAPAARRPRTEFRFENRRPAEVIQQPAATPDVAIEATPAVEPERVVETPPPTASQPVAPPPPPEMRPPTAMADVPQRAESQPGGALHRAETLSRLSRQMTPRQVRGSGVAAEVSRPTQANENAGGEASAATAEVARQAPSGLAARPVGSPARVEATAPNVAAAPSRVARTTGPEPTIARGEAGRVARSSAAQPMPRAVAADAGRAPSRAPSTETPSAANVATERSSSESPSPVRRGEASAPASAAVVAGEPAPRQQAADAAPQQAVAAIPAAERRQPARLPLGAPVVADVPSRSAAGSSGTVASNLSDLTPGVARQSMGGARGPASAAGPAVGPNTSAAGAGGAGRAGGARIAADDNAQGGSGAGGSLGRRGAASGPAVAATAGRAGGGGRSGAGSVGDGLPGPAGVDVARQTSGAAPVGGADVRPGGGAARDVATSGAGAAAGGGLTRVPLGPSSDIVARAPNGGSPSRATGGGTRPNLIAAAGGGARSVGTGQGGEASALPAASAVVRQATSGPPTTAGSIGSGISRDPAPSETTAIAPQVARAGSGRGAGNGTGSGIGNAGSLNPLGRAGGAPSRAASTAVAASSPRPIESPSLGGAGGNGNNPLGEPSRVAVSRGEGGVAGGGAGPNLGNAEPAGSGTGTVASGSFARANARTDDPIGSAAGGGGASTLLARGAASRGAATSSIAAASARPGADGGRGGSGELADNATSAGAAIVRGDAAGPGGTAAGSAGTAAVDVDFGPTQVVAEVGGAGAGAGSNGGQPLLNADTSAAGTGLVRSEAGLAPAASLAATVAGNIAAPAGTGGGDAGGLDPSGAGLASVRTDGSGGTGVTTAGPTTEAPVGPVAGANFGDDIGPAFAARGGAAEALHGDDIAGGGDPGAGVAGNLGRATSSGRGPGIGSLAAIGGGGGGSGGNGGDGLSGGLEMGELAATKTGSGDGATGVGGLSGAGEEIGGSGPGTVGGAALARAATTAGRSGSDELGDGAGGGGSLGRTAGTGPAISGGGLQAAAGAAVATGGTAEGAAGAELDGGGLATSRTAGAGGAAEAGGGMNEAEGIAAAGGIPAAELVGQLQLGRVEGIDAEAGFAQGGGGDGGVTRAASGTLIAGATQAESVGGNDGIDATAGPSDRLPGDGGDSPDAVVVRAAGGAAGTGADSAAAGVDDTVAGTAGAALAGSPTGGVARSTQGGDDGLGGAGMNNAGPTEVGRSATAVGHGAGLQAEATGAGGGATGLAGTAGNGGLAPDLAAVGAASRQQGGVGPGGLVVDFDAPEGPGGLGEEYAFDAGFATRRSQTDSRELQIQETRFIRNEPGGVPATAVNVALSSDAYRDRGRRPGRGVKGAVGASKTEDTVELGLGFLARHQGADGRWSLHDFGNGKKEYAEELKAVQLRSDTAATGLSLLSFLGAGYHHQEDVYRDQVRRGLEWLVKHQKENGDLYVPADDKSNSSAWLYSHGIGTLALCEAYGMTQDPQLREPAQRAINFIVQSQQQSRGGWRYKPNEGSDLSVTGWITTALKSGALAGLDVPPETFAKVDMLLNQSQGGPRDQALYVYNPLAPDTDAQRHGRSPSRSMTSVGLLLRLYSGWRRDNPAMQRGADYILQDLPAAGTTRKPQRDTYYWYYATQVMYHMGGRHWQAWNGKLHPLLVESQVKSGPLRGSWDARGPVPDRWGPQAGRIYVTALNLLSLEVSYRHLPLYEDQAK